MTTRLWRARRALGFVRPLTVHTYRSYGAIDRAWIRGRVLEDKGVGRATPGDPWSLNLHRTWRRMVSVEVPHARLRVRCMGTETYARADAEGYLSTWVVPERPPTPGKVWHTVEVEIVDPDGPGLQGPFRRSAILVPEPAARFGVVSDVDDTVIRTDVARVARLILDVAIGSAHTRVPFPGVGAFFRALHRGTGIAANPVFYVSNGPWNLYDVLDHFLELRGIPHGPIELRDWSAPWNELRRLNRRAHKTDAIRQILQTYPTLPFLLIGDSGEEDPEIYRDLVHEFPARIPAVYIRDVAPDPRRKASVRALAEEVSAAGSALVLAEDTLAAARHAAEHGWIDGAAVDEVAADRAAEGKGPGESVVMEDGRERHERT